MFVSRWFVSFSIDFSEYTQRSACMLGSIESFIFSRSSGCHHDEAC